MKVLPLKSSPLTFALFSRTAPLFTFLFIFTVTVSWIFPFAGTVMFANVTVLGALNEPPDCQITPSGSVSVIVPFTRSSLPEFVTVIVYVSVSPTFAVCKSTVFVIEITGLLTVTNALPSFVPM